MSIVQMAWLMIIFAITSVVSVTTGGTSLITVPAMMQFHIEPRTAIATNMFALTLMSLGASLPLVKSGNVDRRRFPRLLALTLLGSIVGAILLLFLPARSLAAVVPSAMIAVALFSAVYRNPGVRSFSAAPAGKVEILGYALTFLLGVYGGFFSGGYVTIITAVFVGIFRQSFREAIATTKLLNVCSSGIATAVFVWRGLVDYKLGIILGVSMFVGGVLGAKFVAHAGERWLRRIFLAAVWILGLKALVFDVLGRSSGCNAPSPARQ